jgi:hypothetical protein
VCKEGGEGYPRHGYDTKNWRYIQMTPNLNQCVDFLRNDIAVELRRANEKLQWSVNKLEQKSGLSIPVISDALNRKPGLTVKGLAKMAGAMGCRVQVMFIPFGVTIPKNK